MSQILINDIFDELKQQNNRLKNELLLAQKCVHLLEKYRNCLISFSNNCKCNENINNKLVFHSLEKDFNEYQSLRTIEDIIECNEKTFNCDLNEEKNRNKRKQILRPNNGFELITHQNNDLDINESNVCNNGSQTQPKDEDFGSDYKAINCNESQSFGKSFKQKNVKKTHKRVKSIINVIILDVIKHFVQ
jgi:hypothetical protein